MIDDRPSRTAERVAIERAAHQYVDSPIVFTDPLAIRVIDPAVADALRRDPAGHDARTRGHYFRAILVIRSLLAESELSRAVERGVDQYVVLGAGLDTFAYRNPFASVRVFEVDHPATQAWKRARLQAAGIEAPSTLTYVACDFERGSLAPALAGAGFDPTKPAVLAWLGVAMYLERADVLETLRYIAALPAPSAVVFDYAVPLSSVSWLGQLVYQRFLARLTASGEPWKSFFTPEDLGSELRALGFREIDDLGGDAINTRFLANRRDGLKAGSVGRIAIARRT